MKNPPDAIARCARNIGLCPVRAAPKAFGAASSKIFLVVIALCLANCNVNTGRRGRIAEETVNVELRKAILPNAQRLENVYYDIDHPTEIYAYKLPQSKPAGELQRRLLDQLSGWEAKVESEDTVTATKTFPQQIRWCMQIVLLLHHRRVVFGYRETPITKEQTECARLKDLIEQKSATWH